MRILAVCRTEAQTRIILAAPPFLSGTSARTRPSTAKKPQSTYVPAAYRADVQGYLRHFEWSCTCLLHDLPDDLGFRDSCFGQAFIHAVVRIAQFRVIEPELVKYGRHQIGNAHPIRHGAMSKLV